MICERCEYLKPVTHAVVSEIMTLLVCADCAAYALHLECKHYPVGGFTMIMALPIAIMPQ